MKHIPTLFLLFFSFLVIGQEQERVQLHGQISAPDGQDIEGISVYNISSERGTLSNENGEFLIQGGENDRILISALQYQDFTIIVNAGEIKRRELHVHLNNTVNRLDDVLIRDTDLTGVLEGDVKRIKTSVFTPNWDLSQDALAFGYKFERDQATAIDGVIAEDALNLNDVRALQVNAGELLKLFASKRKKKPTQYELARSSANVANDILQRYGVAYVTKTFGVEAMQVNDFLYFASENGLDASWLQPENEVELLQFLFVESEIYRKQSQKKN